MLGKVFVGPRVSDLDIGKEAEKISRVILNVDSENSYIAGDSNGRTIEKTVPWATQAMAESVLNSLKNVSYRPFDGTDGLLDLRAEIGDGITVGGTYSVLAYAGIEFDKMCAAGISAPAGSEIEDEYPYKSKQQRQYQRETSRIYSTITKSSTEIKLLVANEVEGLEGKITLTATSLTTEINNTRDGLNSKIEQTASSLTSEINDVNNNLSSRITQTASSLTSQINSAEGEISQLQQTTNSLSFTATSQGNQISSLWSAIDGFSLEVSNGEYSSTLRLMSGYTQLSSAEIEISGMVTFYDLSHEGNTTINGGNITTGTINAANVGVSDSFTVYDGWRPLGYMGAGYGNDGNGYTSGIMLSSLLNANYIIVTNSGVRMEDDHGGAIWVTGGNCFSSEDMQTYSDRRLKTDIDYDLECYKAFFRELKPCRFLMLSNPAGGYHTGFIAQDVQAAMEKANLSSMDFAGLADAGKINGETVLSLSYGSFAALNTMMTQSHDRAIQDLERRVDDLERRISA